MTVVHQTHLKPKNINCSHSQDRASISSMLGKAKPNQLAKLIMPPFSGKSLLMITNIRRTLELKQVAELSCLQVPASIVPKSYCFHWLGHHLSVRFSLISLLNWLGMTIHHGHLVHCVDIQMPIGWNLGPVQYCDSFGWSYILSKPIGTLPYCSRKSQSGPPHYNKDYIIILGIRLVPIDWIWPDKFAFRKIANLCGCICISAARTHQSGLSGWHWVWFQWEWPSRRCRRSNKHLGSCLSSALHTSAPSGVCAALPLDSCQLLEG